MKDPVLLGEIERADDGTLRILAPSIGWWSDPPHRGAWVGPGSAIGTIRRLNQRYRLLLPDGAAGRVGGAAGGRNRRPVAYGEVLFELTPLASTEFDEPSDDQAELGHPPDAGLASDQFAVVAPSDGVFYRRATPEAPAFVDRGGRIRLGQPVGLVEVMKTFNQILYDGPGFPSEAEVVEIRADDGEEIRAGQILIVVR